MILADSSLISALRVSFDVELKENISIEELREKLANYINRLVIADFNRLINLLYRLDISESKLKAMLVDHAGMETGMIVADLIIERQLQKLKSREDFRKTGENNIDENEKW